MIKIVLTLGFFAACMPIAVAAAPLEAEDAVAYLFAGVQVSGTSVVAGTELVWQRQSAGNFVAVGQSADQQVQMNIDVRKIGGCIYEMSGNVLVDGEVAATIAPATFDFAKITTMELIRPDLAGVDGTRDFCTSSDPGVCSSVLDLAVATDATTYSQVYADFRSSNCP